MFPVFVVVSEANVKVNVVVVLGKLPANVKGNHVVNGVNGLFLQVCFWHALSECYDPSICCCCCFWHALSECYDPEIGNRLFPGKVN